MTEISRSATRHPASHHYEATVVWTGNRGTGTSAYRDFGREHDVISEGRPTLAGSADPAFRGDPERWNPEDFLVAALAECHMLTFLHLAALGGVIVTDYVDTATGTMEMNKDGSGQFSEVTLHPVVTIQDESMREKAMSLHHPAGEMCFIARSVNFPVNHDGTVVVTS